MRYGWFTTEHKPNPDAEPLRWTASGEELDLYKESQEQWQAKAYRKRRENAAAGRDQSGKPAGVKKVKKSAQTFSKLDFFALVETENLTTPAEVLEYSKQNGSAAIRAFVVKSQRRLQEFLDDAREWREAEEVAAQERLSDWDLIQSTARKTCKCPGGLCQWWEAAESFFDRNVATIDRRELASALALVINQGPGKNSRVPLIVGATNSAKSTVLNPLISLFGFSRVVHRPGEKASMALANVTKKHKRFIYWDEYRPVEYAARGTVPVGTFLSLFSGGALEITVSQSFQNGNTEMRWCRGAAMTAKDEGLWDPVPPLPGLIPVTREDIRHMQGRVRQFLAMAPVPPEGLADVPYCKESFCRWLLSESAQSATSSIERPLRQLTGRMVPALPSDPAASQQRGIARGQA